ncbi:DUF4433 domain-containing protein, partial [Candidatus Sumerlaeota bacterium]|nr:DUF4433 domain-containing protein [Candidatus Sumerlaeota bacterium]
MTEDDLQELHCITPIDNVASIVEHGILCHNEVRRRDLKHCSVAMPEIQERREGKSVLGGKLLHEYANLYLNARNPMMFKRHDRHQEICVLRISKLVLHEEGVVISDRNASSGYTRFYQSPAGLKSIEREVVFARYWTHPGDEFAEWHHKSVM